jgi:hypothetical protein
MAKKVQRLENEVSKRQKSSEANDLYTRANYDSIPMFSGENCSMIDLIAFQSAANAFIEQSKYEDFQKTSLIVAKLSGGARLHWSSMMNDAKMSHTQLCDFLDPTTLVQTIIEHFRVPQFEVIAAIELSKIRF